MKKKKKKEDEKNDFFEIPTGQTIELPARAEVFKQIQDQVRREPPEKEISFDEWKALIIEKFPELALPAEIGMSVIGQLLVEDVVNPFGLVFVDVPASGKTITLNFFDSVRSLIYTSDNFTPASFVSHASNKSADALKDVDMLPKITYKAFLVRDLAPIFGQRDDDLLKSMGILTRVFDGEGIETQSGVHGKRGYKGDYNFMFLAASTPIQSRIWKCMGSFGSRLFFLHIGSKEKSENTLARQVMGTPYRENEFACRKLTGDFMKTLWLKGLVKWDREKDNPKLVVKIARFAKLLARLRGVIFVWGEKDELGRETDNIAHNKPSIERPDRINQLLYNLARGHALIQGRQQIDESDLAIVRRVVFDSAPKERISLLEGLIGGGYDDVRGDLKASEVESVLECSRPTALKYMAMFQALGLVGQFFTSNESGIRLRGEFYWLIEDTPMEEPEDPQVLI